MTTTGPRQSKSNVVRIIASSLCFDSDPPIIRNLGKAREAAAGIYDALVGAHVIAGDDDGPTDDVDGADVPLFPPNGLVTVPADPEG